MYVGEPKRRSGFVHIAEHLLEERFVLLPGDAQPRLRDKVSKWQRAGN